MNPSAAPVRGATMRALVARGAAGLAVEEVARPEPGPGDARIRISACGICGSDLHLQSAGLYPPGVVPGHEFAGWVDALGPGTEGFAPGDPVAVEPFRSCGGCRPCREGRDPCCGEARLLGLHEPGGLAEYVVAPSRRLFAVPADLDPRLAALTEPTAVAIHGLERLGEAPERLLVLGAGSIGLLTLLAARSRGVPDVWITARHAHQARLAEALGASRVLREAESGVDALGRLERPFDAVVETVGGRADTLAAAAAALRPGGTVSVVGFFTGAVSVDALPLMLKELRLAWSYCYHRRPHADFARAVALLDAEREGASSLATHAVALDDAPRAYALAADKRAGVVKVSVVP